MRVYFEQCPAEYVGAFPSVTIHYRPQDRLEAEAIAVLLDAESEGNPTGHRDEFLDKEASDGREDE